MKRVLSVLLALVLLCPAAACAAAQAPEGEETRLAGHAAQVFSDVAADDWYAPAVGYCEEQGLLSGTPEGTFAPDLPASRAMLVTALHRMAGSPSAADAGFPDIPEGIWYASGAAWAAGAGLVNGYSDGRFGGDDPVTREQLAAILWRREGQPQPEEREPFADQAELSAYAVDAVAWAKSQGIIHGREENRFDPGAAVTRGEAAMIFYRDARRGSPEVPQIPQTEEPAVSAGGRILVAYFSCTQHTKKIAGYIQTALGEQADLYEILPEEPYTAADLDYNSDCRANREQEDSTIRPAIRGAVEDMEQYDVVFLGYPIWWGQEPRIISTFLERYDWAGKTVVPFCTSGSSGYHDSGIRDLVGESASWITGRRFSGNASLSDVTDWVERLDLPGQEQDRSVFYVSVNGQTLAADFADNSSAAAFWDLLARGPVTVVMDDYGNFEKVGPLGSSLPRNDSQITTEPGDVILYQGSHITIYYDQNSWNFTRLGKIRDLTQDQLKEALGAGMGEVSITFSLEPPEAR